MTARPPLNLAGLTREELTEIVRDLEKTCNTQDAGIQAAVVREGRLFLDNKAMKETLQNIFDSDCESQGATTCRIWVYKPGSRKCVHLAAHEVLEQIEAKNKET